jgi:hypothetical protein
VVQPHRSEHPTSLPADSRLARGSVSSENPVESACQLCTHQSTNGPGHCHHAAAA